VSFTRLVQKPQRLKSEKGAPDWDENTNVDLVVESLNHNLSRTKELSDNRADLESTGAGGAAAHIAL